MSTASPIRWPRRQGIRFLLRAGIRAAFLGILDQKIEGRENLPKKGPAILVGNHFAFLDPLVFIALTDLPIEFFSGFTNPYAPRWTRIFTDAWGTIRVRRGSSSRDALLAAEGILRQGGLMGIFPEGGNWAQVLRPARPGAALLAVKTDAPIVPVGLTGLFEAFPFWPNGRRAPVTIRIGQPFRPQLDPTAGMRQQMEQAADQIMHQIAALIPASCHGVYSTDPALREAAREAARYPFDGAAEG